MYHRKNGQVIKFNDDLMSATRYAVQSLRYAKTAEVKRPQNHAIGTKEYEWDAFEDWGVAA